MGLEYLNTVKRFYRRAETTADTMNQLLDLIEHKVGLKARQLMHADSICCDDVNIIQYPLRAYDMLGPFKLGGLSGFPFAGIAGMNAFANHVPEDGGVVIFYAPHIGITRDGRIGEIQRIGQRDASACCGAVQMALNKLVANEIIPDDIGMLEHQMNVIEQIFLNAEERIRSAEIPVMEATEVMYTSISRRIDVLISRTSYPCQHLIIVGGIFINGDKDTNSYFEYRRLEYLNLATNQREDWLK